jgi:hypothetical protein
MKHDEVVAVFQQNDIRNRHFYIIDELLVHMAKIPRYKFEDVVMELVHDRRITDRVRLQGSDRILKYLNTQPTDIFLNYITAAIDRIGSKLNR